MNLFAEKMYIFLYWWMLFTLICTLISFFAWLVQTVLRSDRLGYIRNHLIHTGKIPPARSREDDELVEEFTYNYLRLV